MSFDDWGNDASADNDWTKDISTESEQDVNIPEFTDTEIKQLIDLGSGDNSERKEANNGGSDESQYGKIRKKRGSNYRDSWQPFRSYGGGSSGTRYAWGMGYGPSGPYNQRSPEENNAIKYLVDCGTPLYEAINLHSEILRRIEPEYCGICKINLENYIVSRAHYRSRGHYKRLSKRRNPQSEVDYQHPKKEHLHPREELCELCNVQITSKVHADSHYAGKPHRAIVEGRKQPKNIYLLQQGGRHRLELLIKREKKLLAPVKQKDSEPVAPKPSQPELSCEICKTSVTCTEQMTSHLNGKRHLAKEKQHILKMMKGETTDKRDENASKDNYPESQEEQAGDDTDDWGADGGTWEDPQ